MPVQIDMDMPKSCEECRFCIYEPPSPFCAVTNYIVLTTDNVSKMEWCPLQEVKE